MSNNNSNPPRQANRPKWWQLYLMLPLLCALFLVEMRLSLTYTEHIVAQLGILLLIYAYTHAWLGANRRLLMGIDAERGEGRIRTYEIRPATPTSDPVSREVLREPFHLPKAGLKGVLSTTFELEDSEDAPAPFVQGSSQAVEIPRASAAATHFKTGPETQTQSNTDLFQQPWLSRIVEREK